MEKFKTVMARKIVYDCDWCKEGEMIFTKQVSEAKFVVFLHKCTDCGYIATYDCIYPKIISM